MKLSALRKVITASSYIIMVFRGDEYVEDFEVNYKADTEELKKSLLKMWEVLGAEVQNVSPSDGKMWITVDISKMKTA